VLILDFVRIADGHPQSDREILGEMHSSEREYASFLHRTSTEDHHAGEFGTHVDEKTSVFPIVFRKSALRCRERFKEYRFYLVSAFWITFIRFCLPALGVVTT